MTNAAEPIPLSANARSVLLIVDMQKFFFRLPERRVNLEQVVANINRLSDCFDAAGMPVYHVITAYQADGSDWDLKMKAWGLGELITGSEDAELLPEVHRAPGHFTLVKTRYSAFFKTDLAERLHDQEIQRVIVTGAYTHYCVNSTVFDAYAHDFVPGIITDAVTSHMVAEAEMMITRMRRNGYHVLTTEEYLRTSI